MLLRSLLRMNRRTATLGVIVAAVAATAADARADECFTWEPLGNGTNDRVFAMSTWSGDPGMLFVGGWFTSPGSRIARWTGTNWNTPSALNVQGGVVLALGSFPSSSLLHVGGAFSGVNGMTGNHARYTRWNGTNWSGVGADNLVRAFAQGGEGFPAIAAFAGGDFTNAVGISASRVVGVKAGTVGEAFGSGVNNDVFAILNYDDGTGPALYVAGNFTMAGGQPASRIAKWNGFFWSPLGSGLDAPVADGARSLVVFDDGSGPAVYVGGFFNSAGNVPGTANIAKWDGENWHAVGGGTNGRIRTMHVFDDGSGPALFVGGSFTEAGGLPALRIAKWDGRSWHPVTTGMSAIVDSLTTFEGFLHAGGDFLTAGGVNVNHIAKMVPSTAVNYWTGGSGNFHLSSNWLCPTIPGPATNATFDSTAYPMDPNVFVSIFEDTTTNRLFINSDTVWINQPLGHTHSLVATQTGQPPSLRVGLHPLLDTRLMLQSGTLSAKAATIADGPASVGRIVVDGTNDPLTTLETAGNFIIGREGQGTLIVENDGTLATNNAGGAGASGIITVGDHVKGTVTVRTGGKWNTPSLLSNVRLANQPGSEADVRIIGGSSVWSTLCNTLTIGESGHAELCILDGATLNSTVLNEVRLARNPGSFAHVIIDGPGSTWVAPGQVIATGDGETLIDVANGGEIQTALLNNFKGSTIAGDGTIATTAQLFNVGAIAPGTESLPGALTIQGNYRQIGPPPGGGLDDSGSLRITLGKSGASELNVTGTAELGGGLFVELADGADPQPEQMFDILTAGSIDPQNPTFDVAFMPGLTEGRFMKVEYGGGTATSGGDGAFITVDLLANLLGFGDPELIGIGGVPTDVAIGDFDDDGSLDIAVTLQGDTPSDPGSVLVLYNDGTGQSFATQQFTVGNQPSALAVGDFTGSDGLDIAVANAADNTVSFLLNTGTGSFSSGDDVTVGVAPSAIVAASFAGDGVIDLAVANAGDDTVMVLENDGSGSFSALAPVAVGSEPSDLVAGDFTINGQLDLAVANFGDNTVSILGNDSGQPRGLIETQTLPVGLGPLRLDAEDLDNNKDLDLIVINASSGDASILKADGLGGYAPAVNVSLNGEPRSLASWDMNGNTLQDLAIVVNDAEVGAVVRILRNDTVPGSGSLVFTFDEDIAEGENPVLVTSGDVTGNDTEDLITVNAGNTAIAGGTGADTTESSVAVHPNLLGSPTCEGDLTGSGEVNVDDLLMVLNNWGSCPGGTPGCPGDATNDGEVNVDDLLEVLNNWGACG